MRRNSPPAAVLAAATAALMLHVSVLSGAPPVTPIRSSVADALPDAILQPGRPDGLFGAVARAGDINSDGYDDVLVGAPHYTSGEENEGAVFVYLGGSGGLATVPARIIEGNQEYALMGTAAGAGDVNGDGYDDVIVGAEGFVNSQNRGTAFIYHGGPQGLNEEPSTVLFCDQHSRGFGQSVAGAGDVNGDGYSDVVVGAYNYFHGQGAVFVYLGSPDGILPVASTVLMPVAQREAVFGFFVSGAGDVNGDGFYDVMASAPMYDDGEVDEGAVFIFHGGPTGVDPTPETIIESNQTSARMSSVAAAGDVNSDGYDDVIIGAKRFDGGEVNEGAAFIHLGSPAGIQTQAHARFDSSNEGFYFGASVAGAGDINADGYDDVLVASPKYEDGQAGEGAGVVYFGGSPGMDSEPDLFLDSDHVDAHVNRVSPAGDVNGDGVDDVLTGATNFRVGETFDGVAFVYHGSMPRLSVANAVAQERDSGVVVLSFTVTLAPSSGRTATVRFATAPGTASTSDFEHRTGVLEFAPGQHTRTVDVSVFGDRFHEGAETFALLLSDATNATIDRGTATATILDDDSPARLNITKTAADTGTLYVGDLITYQITVANTGTSDAADVMVTDALPADVVLASVSTTQGSCGGTQHVACNLGTLSSSASAMVTLTVRPRVAGPLSNTAVVVADGTSPDPVAASASVAVTVNASAQVPALSLWMIVAAVAILGAFGAARLG